MNTLPDDPSAQLRRGVYWLLIVMSTGAVTGRILAVNAVDRIGTEEHRISDHLKKKRAQWVKAGKEQGELMRLLAAERRRAEKSFSAQRPFMSANDRSRWCTVRALVEHGTYEIDEIRKQRNWDTIDLVKHRGRDNKGHFYSSKPTLFPTLMAAEYWVIHKITGVTLGTHPYEIGRFMLITINVLPLIVFFVLLARLAETYGKTDWGRIFVVAAAAFGTFLTTFAVVINNHLIAAVCVMIASYAAIRIWYEGERRWWYFSLAGLFAAFAATVELPALSFLGLFSAALLFKAPRLTLWAYVPAVLVVAAGALGTNYAAHGTVVPAYAHRVEGDDWRGNNWYNFKEGNRPSYWADPKNRAPIDRGEENRAVYAFHVLLGHHGIFSLTPVWLLSAAGVGMLWFSRGRSLKELAVAIAILSVVVIAFYVLMRPTEDRNYGGLTSGFRWAFWLAPLWLFAMLPAADWASTSRAKRCGAGVLLAMSVLSASYPVWNPWTHPWIYNWMLHLGFS